MATCLRCDHCTKTATEQDEGLSKWWSLERYGRAWVPEPGKAGEVAMMPAMVMLGGMIVDEDDDDDDEDEFETTFLSYTPPSVDVTLHFCSAGCLGAWAGEAASFEQA